MALKHTYEKEADVPADHKALYVLKKDFELVTGTKQDLWVLDVEDVVPKRRFVEFRTNNETLMKENREIKDRFAGIDDPDRARALITVAKDVAVEDAEKYLKKGGIEAMIAEHTKAVKADMDKKLAESNSKLAAATAALDKEIISNALLAACSKVSLHQGAEAAILKLAEGVWSRKDGQIVSLDANGNPKPSLDGTGNLSIGEWLQEDLLKKNTYLVKESSGGGAGGSGPPGGSGDSNVNPWMQKTFNLTNQMIMMKKDPQKAERMRLAAQGA